MWSSQSFKNLTRLPTTSGWKRAEWRREHCAPGPRYSFCMSEQHQGRYRHKESLTTKDSPTLRVQSDPGANTWTGNHETSVYRWRTTCSLRGPWRVGQGTCALRIDLASSRHWRRPDKRGIFPPFTEDKPRPVGKELTFVKGFEALRGVWAERAGSRSR